MAMRHRAWLAWRLPPVLRRCRVIMPEEASTGEPPLRAAKEASLRSLWVVAGCDQRDRRGVWADAFGGAQCRVGGRGEIVEVPAQLGEVGVEGLVLAARERR